MFRGINYQSHLAENLWYWFHPSKRLSGVPTVWDINSGTPAAFSTFSATTGWQGTRIQPPGFDRENNYIEYDGTAGQQLTGGNYYFMQGSNENWTIISFIRPDVLTSRRCIISKDTATGNRQILLALRTTASDGSATIGYWNSADVFRSHVSPGSTFDTSWQMIGGMRQGSDLHIIRNGKIVSTGVGAAPDGMKSATAIFRFGRSGMPSFENPFDGGIGGWMLFGGKALSSWQLKGIYEDWLHGFPELLPDEDSAESGFSYMLPMIDSPNASRFVRGMITGFIR